MNNQISPITAQYLAFVERARAESRPHTGGKPPSKVTKEIVMTVQLLKESGNPVSKIAELVGLSQTLVREIIRGY